MLTTKQQLEPILQEFFRLKSEWRFDENKGVEQIPNNDFPFSSLKREAMLIAYGRFCQCTDLINKISSYD